MKHALKRMGAILLALAMFVTMLPLVSAATDVEVTVPGLSVTWEYTGTQQAGYATWTGSGNTIIGECKSNNNVKSNTSKVTFTNTMDCEAVLKFNFTKSGGGTLTGLSGTSGAVEKTLAPGASFSFTLKTANMQKVTTLTITDIALLGTVSEVTAQFQLPAMGGSYTLDGAAVTQPVEQIVTSGDKFALKAQAEDGYNFLGWYDEVSGMYLSQDAEFTLQIADNVIITPVFVDSSVVLFGVGAAKYDDLNKACAAAAASNVNKVVVQLNDGTIAGDYTIPAGVTLLIPYNDEHTSHGQYPGCTSADANSVKWSEPYAYRTLTLAAGTTITVNGALEIGGRHSAAGGTTGYYGAPSEALGYLYMTADSYIQVNNGGNLYAWGYVYGDGKVTVKAGASTSEIFQITDFRGGTAASALGMEGFVFPITQYYVQNLEVATTYEYGSVAYAAASAFVGGKCLTTPAPANDENKEGTPAIRFIGEGGMFQTSEGSYIVKTYDPATDTLNMEAYGDCVLSTMEVTLENNHINTKNFQLPITSNINITIKSGTASMNQDIIMLPGSSLTVEEGAILDVGYAETPSATMSAGHNLILVDRDNWSKGYHFFKLMNGEYELEENLHFVHPSVRFVPVAYTPSQRKVRTEADLTDATLDINGAVVGDGFVYSTVDWADPANGDFSVAGGGANVISSKGTGILALNSGAGVDIMTLLYDQTKDTAYKQPGGDYDAELGLSLYYVIPIASVQLKNGNGSLLDTTGAEPGAIYTYCQEHKRWIAGEECNLPLAVEITWVVNGESVTAEVEYDTVPVCPIAPEKAMDNNYHYDFAGWSTTANGAVIDLPAAEADTTYYAVFTAVAHTYEATAVSGKHACACGKKASCFDADGDGNHLCDLGCGAAKSEHVGGTATCDKLAVCSECKQGYGDYAAHTPGAAADCENAQVCTKCGAELKEALGHDYVGAQTTAPTCGAAGVMTYTCACGASYTEEIPATGEHTYDNEYDADCNVCGDVREVPEKPPVGDIVYGDADGDGEVTLEDASTLQLYLAGYEVDIDLVAADADGDGEVTLEDASTLQLYLAGYDVTLGPV